MTKMLRAFYAARGMWVNGGPQGYLAMMLGPRVPSHSTYNDGFYVSAEQLHYLEKDLRENGPRGLSSKQIAQSLRRLREARERSGAAPIAPASGIGSHPADAPAIVPFKPLQCPAAGKAKKSFEDHVMRTLREFVEFAQSSEYLGDSALVAPIETGMLSQTHNDAARGWPHG